MIGKTNSVVVSGGGSSENTLKKLLDTTGSASYLFDGYMGTSVDDLIQYSDTENVITMANMFQNCSKLTSVPLLNTGNVTSMTNMFYYCHALTAIPQLNTSNVKNMSYMLQNCRALTTIPLLDTSKTTNMSGMLYNCSSLITVPALNADKVTNMDSMFNGCTKLKSILMTNIGVNLNISASTQFERADLLVILNNLKTVTSSKKLTMGADNLAKLTEEDKAIATNKG